MPLRNSMSKYGSVAISFHWLIALIVIGLLALGIYMTYVPISLWKLKLYGWHKEFGILVLMLAILRISWRFSNIEPMLPDYMPHWQKKAARYTHFLLYFFLFALPLTGWMMSSATGLSVSFFGLFVLPDLVSTNETLRVTLLSVHQWLGYSLIAVLCLHIGATIQHYVLYKDNILRRMLP